MLFYRCGRVARSCPSSTEVRTQPCCMQHGREQAHRARRITTCFSVQLARISHDQRIAFALQGPKCRCDSFVVCVQGTTIIVNCASAEIHMKDPETHATAICLLHQVNFPMLLKLRVGSKSIIHPQWLANMCDFTVIVASNRLYRVFVLQMKWT